MPYIDGFVIPVPTANKEKFIEHARKGDAVFMELGALRILECWGDDRPRRQRHRFSPRSTGKGRRDGRVLVDRVAGQGYPRCRNGQDNGARENRSSHEPGNESDAVRRSTAHLWWICARTDSGEVELTEALVARRPSLRFGKEGACLGLEGGGRKRGRAARLSTTACRLEDQIDYSEDDEQSDQEHDPNDPTEHFEHTTSAACKVRRRATHRSSARHAGCALLFQPSLRRMQPLERSVSMS